MNDRSDEIIKQLNRLANDRTLAPIARNKLHDAVQHIRDLSRRLHGREAALPEVPDICLDDPATAEEAAMPAPFGPLDTLLPRSRKLLRALHG